MKIDKNTDLNKLAIETFKSNYLKNYLYKIEHKFTLEEIVTIVWNSNLLLDDKISIYHAIMSILLDEEVSKKYIIKDEDELIKNIQLILDDYKYILDALFEINKSIKPILLFYDEYDIARCFSSIDALDKKLTEDSSLNCSGITLIDGNTSNEIAYIELEKDKKYRKNILSYSLYKPVNDIISELYDKYIDIPNDLEVGDVVTIINDKENKRYVITADSTLPDKLKEISDYSVDACVTIIPEDVLDKNRNYKQQIEEILEKRKETYKDEIHELDIISREHDHIHLSFIEKC